MGYKSEQELDSMTQAQMTRFVTDTLPLGSHPTLGHGFYIDETARYAGTYLLGLPGKGKSGLLENIFHLSAISGQCTILVDPHGDSEHKCIARLPEDVLWKTYRLDPLRDFEHVLTLDFFGKVPKGDPLALMRAIDRAMHLFELHFKDILSQAHFPRYLRAALVVLLSNSEPTLLKLYKLLSDDAFRHQQLRACADESVVQFWQDYDDLSPAIRRQVIDPLKARLEMFIMGRPVVRNILSHAESSIDFREAILKGYIILISLPVKEMPQDARLIGSIILHQIHAAVFSFGQLPPEKRPDCVLILDEWHNFSSALIAELITEGRKFCVKTHLCNQYLAQLPDYLQEAVMATHTKVFFQLTPDDARKVAHLLPNIETTLKPEDMEHNIVGHLLNNGSRNPDVTTFIETYLRPVRNASKKNGKMEVKHPGFMPQKWLNAFLHVPPPANPTVTDPLPDLNDFLYKAMQARELPKRIPSEIVFGFANCGKGFYEALNWGRKDQLLVFENLQFMPDMIEQTSNGDVRWVGKKLKRGKMQLHHFLFHLLMTIEELTRCPIGKQTKSTISTAQELMSLPFRHAYVKAGDQAGVIVTDDTFDQVSEQELQMRLQRITAQTRSKFCKPKSELEKDQNHDDNDEPYSRSEVI